jgi:hypothetical protein
MQLSRSEALQTPVALVIFNRPDLTAEVFATIRAARPRKLLIIADGPRREDERARCEAARAAIKVDWPCELLTNYSDKNLGCKNRVASGIDWVFEQCEEAIVLEDDCLPSASFFPYCEALLAQYRDDERVMCIGGMSLYPGSPARGDETYYFSRYGATNGWATWRRAWRTVDVDLTDWPAFKRSGRMADIFPSHRERWFWTALFDAQHAGEINTWDFQWLFARLVRGGLCTGPIRNMVANQGFRGDATHTLAMPKVWTPAKERHELWDLVHPAYVVPSHDVDRYYFRNIFNPQGYPGIALQRAQLLAKHLRQT